MVMVTGDGGWRRVEGGGCESVRMCVGRRWSVEYHIKDWSLPSFHVAQPRCNQQLLFLPRGLDLRHTMFT